MEEKITIGEVLRPQGIRGEIKIRVLLDDPEEIANYRNVLIGGKEYRTGAVRCDGMFAYLSLIGIGDRDSAEILRGKRIEIPRSEAPRLPEGRYYIVDIVGCGVYDEDDAYLGKITDVISAHTDIFVMEGEEGESMFPIAEDVLVSVDVRKKRIVVRGKRLKEVIVAN